MPWIEECCYLAGRRTALHDGSVAGAGFTLQRKWPTGTYALVGDVQRGCWRRLSEVIVERRVLKKTLGGTG